MQHRRYVEYSSVRACTRCCIDSTESTRQDITGGAYFLEPRCVFEIQYEHTHFVVITEFEQALPGTIPALTTSMLSLNKSASLKVSRQETFWRSMPNFALPSVCTTGLFSTPFKGCTGRRVRMPTVQKTAQLGTSRVNAFSVCYSFPSPVHFNALQVVHRPSSENTDGARDRATWDIASQNLFCVLLFCSSGSVFSVARGLEGKRPQDGPGHGQQARAVLGENCMEVYKRVYVRSVTKLTVMAPGQDLDEFLYIMDSCQDRLSTSTPSGGSTDRQYEDILLQALSQDSKSVRRAHLERREFGLVDMR